jgi:hypothetical protein
MDSLFKVQSRRLRSSVFNHVSYSFGSRLTQRRELITVELRWHALRVALIVATLGASVAPALACYCGVPAVPKAYSRATAVFVGDVSEILPPRDESATASNADKLFRIRLKVERSWKGTSGRDVVILAGQGKGCFDYPIIKVGERYLVYADPLYNEGAYRSDLLYVSLCNRTAKLPLNPKTQPAMKSERADGSRDLPVLDRIRPPVNGRGPRESNKSRPATAFTVGVHRFAQQHSQLRGYRYQETEICFDEARRRH